MHPAPDALVQPRLHVRIGEAEDGDFQSPALHHRIDGEIRLSVVIPDGIARQEGNPVRLELRGDAVIHPVARLDVMVAHCDRVVAHVLDQARIDMRGQRIDVVEIIGGVVPLQAVAGIHEEDMVRPDRSSDTVHTILGGEQGLGGVRPDVGRVEIAAMDVVGGQERQAVLPVFQGVAGGQGEQDRCQEEGFRFHQRGILCVGSVLLAVFAAAFFRACLPRRSRWNFRKSRCSRPE